MDLELTMYIPEWIFYIIAAYLLLEVIKTFLDIRLWFLKRKINK